MFNLLRSEIKKHLDSWLLILFASIIVFSVVYGILTTLSKTAIFPKDNERYDIDTISVGQMKDFCPKEFAANPGRKDFEACIPKLDANKMVEVKIPTFKDTLDKCPNLPYLMAHSLNPKIKRASEYFKEGNYYVIGIKIPEKFFSKDGEYIKNGKINMETADSNVLYSQGVRFGFGCVDNLCSNLFLYDTFHISEIPLVRNDTGKSNYIWIFGSENTTPHGIFLEDGIFIAKSSVLYNVILYKSFIGMGKSIFVSMAFVALFLISITFAIYLRRFYDYPAFSYFAASTALWFLNSQVPLLGPWVDGFGIRLSNIWVILNFLLSILILNLAYARFKSVLKKKYFFISHLLILGLIFFAYVYFKGSMGKIVAVWDRFELTFAIMATLFSLAPLSYSIYKLSKAPLRFDYKTRIRELLIYTFVWIIFCFGYIRYALNTFGNGNVSTEFLFNINIGSALLLLGIMLYYTQSKEVTHMAEALSKQAQFMAHDIRRPFSQIKLVLSMFNSFKSDDKKLEAAKQEVDSSIKHVEAMLSDLIESNKDSAILKVKQHSVQNIVDQALNQIEFNNLNFKIDVVKSIDTTHMFYVDEQKIARCFVNILENAAEAVRSNHLVGTGGVIEISSKKVIVDGAAYIEVVIGNNGPCIDNDDMSKLFNLFFTKGKVKGTGLGLAFTHRVITQHNGTIKARNKPNNNGVEFIVLLPTIKETGVNILLLDDDAVYRSLARTLIAGDSSLSNENVFEASSVSEALEITKKQNITHALIDLDLNNNENGFAYLDYIRKKKLNIICALHTNKYIDQGLTDKIAHYGISYIQKPLDINKLCAFMGK